VTWNSNGSECTNKNNDHNKVTSKNRALQSTARMTDNSQTTDAVQTALSLDSVKQLTETPVTTRQTVMKIKAGQVDRQYGSRGT